MKLVQSENNAHQASNALLGAAAAAYSITALTTPCGEDRLEWTKAKAKGIAVGAAAIASTSGIVSSLKNATGRTRPDESEDLSFPSGHTASAASLTTLAKRNIKTIVISDQKRKLLRSGLTVLAVGTGWARVEAKKHFPSDVLAGNAIGRFMSAFLTMPSALITARILE